MYERIGEALAARRRELGLSQSELAEALTLRGLSVTNQAVSKWEKGATLPNARQLLILCQVLEIEDVRGEFSGGAEGVFAGLDGRGRRMALDYVQLLRDSGRFAPAREPARLRSLPLYSLAVSAGTGQLLDGEDYEMVEVGAEVPEGANFGVRVAGDSMEPRYQDGQTVWVQYRRTLHSGEIGVFLYDDNAYLKQLVVDDAGVRLHSLNPEYRDIVVGAAAELRVLGRAVT